MHPLRSLQPLLRLLGLKGGEVDQGPGGQEAVCLHQGRGTAGRGVQDVLQAGQDNGACFWGQHSEDVSYDETSEGAPYFGHLISHS